MEEEALQKGETAWDSSLSGIGNTKHWRGLWAPLSFPLFSLFLGEQDKDPGLVCDFNIVPYQHGMLCIPPPGS